ncbi:MAG: NUDIX hydrolase N-terminal domain-containing protein [Verrucomicrobiota bacterium]
MSTALEISRELAAIAQAGITYSKDHFDIGRFHRIRQLADALLQGNPATVDFTWPDELGYPTPKVDVRGVIFREDQVLLIREVSSGLWTLPGGWADVNATPRENVERECLEETGYTVAATRITAVLDRERAGYPNNAHSIYKMFFLCSITGGEATPSVESSHIEFFPLHDLPELDPDRARREDILHAWVLFRDGAGETAFN